MGQWIIKDFSRPPRELIEALGKFPCSVLSDCMNRFQSLDASVKPLKSGWRLCGPAFTVQSMESCNWGAHQALTLAKPGDVLVIAARGGTNCAVWGHLMTVAAKRTALAGVVIDGCVRDMEQNRNEEFPIFCRGTSPGGPHKGWLCNINVPVSCAGVSISPGDAIVGNDDGVVVIPVDRTHEVLEEAKRRLQMEKEWYRRIESGEGTLGVIGIDPI